MEEKRALEKKLNRVAWVLSIIVFALVVSMRRFKVDAGIDFSFLPAVYSTLNFITFLLLLAGFYFIRVRKDMAVHRKLMVSALVSSVLFLLGYVVYHMTTPETLFCQEGSIRYVYFFLLITHIVLAAVILPFILFTFIRAYTGQYARHKKMARWVYPLWLYVAATGPILYLMLLPCWGE